MTIAFLSVEYIVGTESGDTVLEKIPLAFERAGEEFEDFGRTLFPKLPAIFEAEVARQIDAGGDGPHGKFAQLSPAYEDWKSKRYPGNPILVAEDHLRQALTQSSSPFALRQFGSDEFGYGTSGIPYASYIQVGTGKMPARPPIDVSSDFERDLHDAALESVREIVEKSKLSEIATLEGS